MIGIVVGDTLFFRCLQILGPRRALMLACFGPLFAAVLGYGYLNELPRGSVFAGMFLTMFGVAAVVSDRRAIVEAPGLMPGTLALGVACGIGAAACQAVGGLFSTWGMTECKPLEATLIRLLVAAVLTSTWMVLKSKQRSALRAAFRLTNLRILLPATAIGTWLGIWLSQIAYQGGNLAVIQTLLCTCPLFAIPIVWLTYGHQATRFAIAGTAFALIGIWLVVSG